MPSADGRRALCGGKRQTTRKLLLPPPAHLRSTTSSSKKAHQWLETCACPFPTRGRFPFARLCDAVRSTNVHFRTYYYLRACVSGVRESGQTSQTAAATRGRWQRWGGKEPGSAQEYGVLRREGQSLPPPAGRRHLPLFPSHLACADRLSRGKRAKSRRESSKPEKTKKKRVQLTLGDLWARMGGSLVRKNRATTSHYRAQGPALRKKKKERRRQGGVDGRSVRLSRVVCLSSASCVRRDRSCAQRKGTGSQREGVKGVVGCNHGI